MTSRIGDWSQVYSGGSVWPLDPREDEIHIEDIAHSLSMMCRFNGHTKVFYSVAQHSLLVSSICDEEDALWGELHDASEFVLSDLARPLKRQAVMQPYVEIEAAVQATICRKFGLPEEMPASVKRADLIALATEARDLMGGQTGGDWDLPYEPLPYHIHPVTQERAKELFLSRFHFLMQRDARRRELAVADAREIARVALRGEADMREALEMIARGGRG